MKLNLNIPDFEQYTSDQQFINVVDALDRLETQKGGLTVEEIWEMAWQVVEQLKLSRRPEFTVRRISSLITSQLEEQEPKRDKADVKHSMHCIMFCVNYLLCANEEEPDPNQDLIDKISEELSYMTDIVELFEAVEIVEDDETAKGNEVKGRNVMTDKEKLEVGFKHESVDGDSLIQQKLVELINRGDWQGVTTEQMKDRLWKALGLGELRLTQEEFVLSNKLWALLRKRDNQDDKGSLRLTWLNIVGWCVTNKLLSGASPKLCKDFFPSCKGDEYKTIDKGKKGQPKKFAEVFPLLETYLTNNTQSK